MLRQSIRILVAASVITPAFAQFDFVDVSALRGLQPALAAPIAGVAVGDYDMDGWEDVIVFGGVDPRPQVFRNNGALASVGADPRWFQDTTKWVMPLDAAPASSGLLVDMDNDGDPDLVVSRRYYDALEGFPDPFDVGLMYYENVDGRFVQATVDPWQARAQRRHGGMTAGDTDGDGDLDIVFTHNGSFETIGGGPGAFIRNDGIPRFVDSTQSFGAKLGENNRYFSAVLADFDGDVDLDLHVAVDFYKDFHCHNDGTGVFTDVTDAVGTTNTGADMGLCVGDMDNDGDLDIYSTNIGIGVLYVNDGFGNFTDEANLRGCQSWDGQAIGWGNQWMDVDLDKDLDLAFVAIGPPGITGESWLNDGTGYFTEVTGSTAIELRGLGMIAWDYDKDGDQDVLITRQQSLFLYDNQVTDDPAKHWVVIDLEGTSSNRDAIGARIELQSPDGTVQTRNVIAGQSYMNGTSLLQFFGLGDTDQISALRIRWPDGTVRRARRDDRRQVPALQAVESWIRAPLTRAANHLAPGSPPTRGGPGARARSPGPWPAPPWRGRGAGPQGRAAAGAARRRAGTRPSARACRGRAGSARTRAHSSTCGAASSPRRWRPIPRARPGRPPRRAAATLRPPGRTPRSTSSR